LGIPQECQACGQLIAPGFRIIMEANDQQVPARSNNAGKIVVQFYEE